MQNQAGIERGVGRVEPSTRKDEDETKMKKSYGGGVEGEAGRGGKGGIRCKLDEAKIRA